MDIELFLSAGKSMVIAPAGYGKTHSIAEAIAGYQGKKKVLVLTHTHAGIASLKDKFTQNSLPSTKYHLDTICSFALDLTKTYHINKSEIPDESDTAAMFGFAIEHASVILRARPIKQLLSTRYDHLIVDEYQDCSLAQHKMILEMSKSIKTHILGDPLQGIFGFRNEPVVDFNDASFVPFQENCQTLEIPWRWNNAGNNALGQDLAIIRKKLMKGEDIDLRDYQSIVCINGGEQDYAIPQTDSRKQVFKELSLDAVVIHPNSASIEPRKAVVRSFQQLQMIEPIDGKDYYKWAHEFDVQSGQPLIKAVAEMMRKVCSKTAITFWIKDNGALVKKQKKEEIAISDNLVQIVSLLSEKKSYGLVAELINAISNLPNVIIYRKDFVRDMTRVLIDAGRMGVSATETLIRNRNIARRRGRKVMKKSIGTTLLTKGLEFDNVVILNAQLFNDPRHLYVAFTRCCKRLVVIANNPVLHPYSE